MPQTGRQSSIATQTSEKKSASLDPVTIGCPRRIAGLRRDPILPSSGDYCERPRKSLGGLFFSAQALPPGARH
jgi:hypothetical protein